MGKLKISQKGFSAVEALLVIVILAVIGAVGYMVYNNHHKTKTTTTTTVTNTSTNPAQTVAPTSSTFTYSPKNGDLKLTLPKTYGIVVSNDGGSGGAPSATFRVALVGNNNVYQDSPSQDAQINIGNTYTGNLSQNVSAEESNLQSEGYTDIKVSDSTVAGIAAKLITADQGGPVDLTEYVVGSGSWEYQITINGAQSSTISAMQAAILKGLVIKPETIN